MMENIALISYAHNETAGTVPNVTVFKYLYLPVVDL